MGSLAIILLTPLFAIIGAFVYGAILCIPLMIGLHFLHAFVPIVPALGWVASFWLLWVVSLLIPHSGGSSD